jgi:hypothetical protein
LLKAALTGVLPTAKGEPDISVNAPVGETLSTETLPPPVEPPEVLIANRNLPLLSKVKKTGDPLIGDVVARAVRAPLVATVKEVI